jgi:hypothetical protein
MAELPLDVFRILFVEHPLPMFIYDAETLQILEVNGTGLSSYGYARDEFLAMRITDIRPPEDVPMLLNFMGDRKDTWFRAGGWRHRHKSGNVIYVDIISHPVIFQGRRASLVIAQDITERRRLEAQLRHSQKMEALGRLAGGISHEFNNVLTAILGFSTLLLEDVTAPGADRTHLEQIHKAATRARSLTVQLLAFSRKQLVEPKVVDANVLIDDLTRMLRRLVGEDVETVVRLDPRVGRVRVDAGELAQVLTNLVINARDAMPGGGLLTIETANVELDKEYARKYAEVTPGSYVMMAVTDSGIGMPPEVLDRLFEPFFTTKASGTGTGLGLATAYGIIKQRNGHIAVYSEPLRGTTFKIYLPRVDDPAPAETVRESAAPPAAAGSVTILVAEDDDEVRALIQDTLERRGYSVLAAATPDEALRLAADDDGRIGLLITDVVMPGLSGPQLAERLTEARHELRIIYMSGFPDEAAIRSASIRPGAIFLQKPFTLRQLEQRVHEILTRPTT